MFQEDGLPWGGPCQSGAPAGAPRAARIAWYPGWSLDGGRGDSVSAAGLPLGRRQGSAPEWLGGHCLVLQLLAGPVAVLRRHPAAGAAARAWVCLGLQQPWSREAPWLLSKAGGEAPRGSPGTWTPCARAGVETPRAPGQHRCARAQAPVAVVAPAHRAPEAMRSPVAAQAPAGARVRPCCQLGLS